MVPRKLLLAGLVPALPLVCQKFAAFSPFKVTALTFVAFKAVVAVAALPLMLMPAVPAVTTTEMIRRVGTVLGRELKIERVPEFVLGAMRLFMPMMRELHEMDYQWTSPFLVDDARFRARFGATPTPLDDGVRAMVGWARAHYAAK